MLRKKFFSALNFNLSKHEENYDVPIIFGKKMKQKFLCTIFLNSIKANIDTEIAASS